VSLSRKDKRLRYKRTQQNYISNRKQRLYPEMSVYILRKKRRMSERYAAKEVKKDICMVLDEVMCPFPTLVLSKQDIYHPTTTHSLTLHLATTTDVLMLTYIIP
jgi:hypothetical protein